MSLGAAVWYAWDFMIRFWQVPYYYLITRAWLVWLWTSSFSSIPKRKQICFTPVFKAFEQSIIFGMSSLPNISTHCLYGKSSILHSWLICSHEGTHMARGKKCSFQANLSTSVISKKKKSLFAFLPLSYMNFKLIWQYHEALYTFLGFQSDKNWTCVFRNTRMPLTSFSHGATNCDGGNRNHPKAHEC